MENSDINCLIDSFLQNYSDSPEYTVDSVQVFKDSVYVVFLREFVALDAVKFFDQYQFRGQRLHAQLINNEDLLVRVNQFFNSDDSTSVDSSSSIKVVEVDCEIHVTTRQFK